MENIAKACMKKNNVISIYTDPDETDNFSAGIIQAINGEDILINHISPHGYYDGYIVKKTDSVYRISMDGQYEQKISHLFSFSTREHEKIEIVDNNIISSLLGYAKQKGLFITVQLLESGYSDVQGTVLNNGDIVTVEEYNNYGQKDGITYINQKDISELRCDTDDEMALRLLKE